MDIDIIKFALGVAGITLAAFIVWLLLREIRLWYWKTNNLIKILKRINRRIQIVEKKIDIFNQELFLICQKDNLSERNHDHLSKARKNKLSSNDNEENEMITAQNIKD